MTGMRLGEVRGLRWGGIEGNRLHVSRQLQADRRDLEFVIQRRQ